MNSESLLALGSALIAYTGENYLELLDISCNSIQNKGFIEKFNRLRNQLFKRCFIH
jgi:hypothetical protein